MPLITIDLNNEEVNLPRTEPEEELNTTFIEEYFSKLDNLAAIKRQKTSKITDENNLVKSSKRTTSKFNYNLSDYLYSEPVQKKFKSYSYGISLKSNNRFRSNSSLHINSTDKISPCPDEKLITKSKVKKPRAVKEINTALLDQLVPIFTPKMSVYDYPPDLEGNKVHNLTNQMDNTKIIHPTQGGSGNYNITMATLCNIGNTCYLNSVVYTLRFAPLFLHNLHHLVDDLNQKNKSTANMSQYSKQKSSSLGRNIGGIVGQSARSSSSKDLTILGSNGGTNYQQTPKTKRQLATIKLHDLYKNLYINEAIGNQDPFHAGTFLQAIQDVSSIFEGNQQQDAHEFLMCILDSIRETCQSLNKRECEATEIGVNGYATVSEQPEIIHATPPTKTSFFSRKSKKKESKIKLKSNIPESPSKDISRDTSTHLQEQTAPTTSVPSGKNGLSLGGLNEADELHIPTLSANNLTTTSSHTIDHDKCKGNTTKTSANNFFTNDFEGVTVFTTKCLKCETITEQKEAMIDISVPISGNENIVSMDKPHLFFQNSCITKEYFRGENKYRCEGCFGYTEAIRSISFEVLPRLLIIQLKRFSGGMEKINSFIPTPLQFNCFCTKCWKMPEGEKRHTYRLYSVITHVGATMSVGHYIAYTSSLNLCTEYLNCQKDNMKDQNTGVNGSQGNVNFTTNIQSSTTSEKNPGLIKKMYLRNKTSSAGDVTKNIKNNFNGVMSKFVNGSDKLLASVSGGFGGDKSSSSSPSTGERNVIESGGLYDQKSLCRGLACCSIGSESVRMRNCNGMNLPETPLEDINVQQTGPKAYNASSTSLTSSSSRQVEPVWYMCDDDKIRAMSQGEFIDLLSPNPKVAITPYLLFYARD